MSSFSFKMVLGVELYGIRKKSFAYPSVNVSDVALSVAPYAVTVVGLMIQLSSGITPAVELPIATSAVPVVV